jgi:hypothetical protein
MYAARFSTFDISLIWNNVLLLLRFSVPFIIVQYSIAGGVGVTRPRISYRSIIFATTARNRSLVKMIYLSSVKHKLYIYVLEVYYINKKFIHEWGLLAYFNWLR